MPSWASTSIQISQIRMVSRINNQNSDQNKSGQQLHEREKCLSLDTRTRALKCYVWFGLPYGCRSWTSKINILNWHETFQLWYYQRIGKYRRPIAQKSNSDVLSMTKKQRRATKYRKPQETRINLFCNERFNDRKKRKQAFNKKKTFILLRNRANKKSDWTKSDRNEAIKTQYHDTLYGKIITYVH